MLLLFVSLLAAQAQSAKQNMPAAMQGRWIITEQLTERSLGCYDPLHAEALVGVELAIGNNELRWNGLIARAPDPQRRMLSRYQFQARYGQNPKELGIASDMVAIVQVTPSEGIPVNVIVVADSGTLLIDACNIWLKAEHDPHPDAS